MTLEQKYFNATSKIFASVQEKNPYYKEQVGHAIYDFVNMICGEKTAPKVTGMLIELSIDQIKQYLGSYEALQVRANEAS
jgi:hypothetical protein